MNLAFLRAVTRADGGLPVGALQSTEVYLLSQPFLRCWRGAWNHT
jgi:hypothetical protein